MHDSGLWRRWASGSNVGWCLMMDVFAKPGECVPPFDNLVQSMQQSLTHQGGQPASVAMTDHIWLAVVEGTLSTGERLPTTRELAVALGVSPRSVERAYQELQSRGVVAIRPGEGAFVSLRPPPEEDLVRHREFDGLCRETFDRARELGFNVDDLIEALSEFRSIERGSTAKE